MAEFDVPDHLVELRKIVGENSDDAELRAWEIFSPSIRPNSERGQMFTEEVQAGKMGVFVGLSFPLLGSAVRKLEDFRKHQGCPFGLSIGPMASLNYDPWLSYQDVVFGNAIRDGHGDHTPYSVLFPLVKGSNGRNVGFYFAGLVWRCFSCHSSMIEFSSVSFQNYLMVSTSDEKFCDAQRLGNGVSSPYEFLPTCREAPEAYDSSQGLAGRSVSLEM